MHRAGSIKFLYLTIFYQVLAGCDQGIQLNAKSMNSSLSNSQTSASAPSSTTSHLNNLEISYSSGPSFINFKHHSGDSILVSNIIQSGNLPTISFFVQLQDATNAYRITFSDLTTGRVVVTNNCSLTPAGPSCSILLGPNTGHSVVYCSSVNQPQSYYVLTPGGYEVSVNYSDGSMKTSIVNVLNPCTSTFVAKVNNDRQIASVPTNNVIVNSALNFSYIISGVVLIGFVFIIRKRFFQKAKRRR